jgi:hypothetical protein
MNKPLLAFGMYAITAIGYDANAAPSLNPPVPPLSSFANCENRNLTGFESYTRCRLPGNQGGLQNFGKPVDGNPQRRHINWMLDKMRIAGYDETVYQITQVAFDCATNKAVLRDVSVFVQNADLTRVSSQVDLRTWKQVESDHKKVMAAFCPVKDGYVRLNDAQYAIHSAIRKGGRVNIDAIGNSGYKYVFVIECSTMMYGVNKQPDKPISPKSVGYEIYKRVCK